MKKLYFVFAFTTQVLLCSAQPVKNPDSFFPSKRTKVLVVGTFHFDYPGLDVYKPSEANKIDVLREPKKTEVTEIVNYIKKFKPTKIAIEATTAWKATQKLREYARGNLRDKRDERYQLAMRIAHEMKLDTLYSIDADPMVDDLAKIDSTYINALFRDFDFKNNDPFNAMYSDWIGYEDGLPSKTNLLAYFKHMNSRKSHQLGYGAYLVGDFKLDDTRGADVLSVWWYNRNLRIFRKLQQLKTTPEDRVLLVFGNGHAALLRQFFESSPEYEFVEFDSLR